MSSSSTSAGFITVVNPATEETIGTLPVTDRAEVEAMVERARQAQPAWAELGVEQRLAIFGRSLAIYEQKKDRLVEVLIMETGKARHEAEGELQSVINKVRYYLQETASMLQSETTVISETLMGVVERHPKGIVTVITSWNFPMTSPFGLIAPALLSGNAVLAKPSEVAPHSMLEMVACLWEAGVPRDVLQVAILDGPNSGVLLDAEVNLVCFVGSTQTGVKIRELLAPRMIPVVLELGGKDPFIVAADADVERAAAACVAAALVNCGQMCAAVERVYVERPVYDRFVELVLTRVKALQAAPGTDGNYPLGPLTTPLQVRIIEEQLRDAVAKGAQILTGGKRMGEKGRFFEPTVIVNVDHSMKMMVDETFGPTIPIMKVESVDEAVRLANDSMYALTATIWCGDEAKANRISREVRSATAWINTPLATRPHMPWGGLKFSGTGRILSKYGMWEFTDLRVFYSEPEK